MSLPIIEVDNLSSWVDDMLHLVDTYRLDVNKRLDPRQKIELGQFLTPMPVARLMASMLIYQEPVISLLDPCAGVGTLFAACVAELCQRSNPPQEIHITAYEIDPILAAYLSTTLRLCEEMCQRVGISFSGEVRQADFVENSVNDTTTNLFTLTPLRTFNCVILNPPYRKIQTSSKLSKVLQSNGVKTTNLYTGFLALCMRLLSSRGEMVAITPRSFCSGTYFKPFRISFLHTMALQRLHLFESRVNTFYEDEVLQETVILSAIKTPLVPETILITSTTSPDDTFVVTHKVLYTEVVVPDDSESCIRIVSDEGGQQIAQRMTTLHTQLTDLGISVSTGRVVDFRVQESLRLLPEDGTVPLIYPTHISSGTVVWPKPQTRKPNAIVISDQSRDLLLPNETYVLVRRFSSKEEKRRVVAVLYEPHNFSVTHVGFENHLNYFHHNMHGLDPLLATGLTAFLNSTFVDMYIRLFNGHTQINATDLRNIRYPTRKQLEELGARLLNKVPSQSIIDGLVEEILFVMNDDQKINPISSKKRIEEALTVLKDLGFPRQQQNERSALTLLALLDLRYAQQWSEAKSPLRGITQMMNFFDQYYGKKYAPNSRETVRRQTIHQFLDAGLIVGNPDNPNRPINSGQTVYQIESSVLELLKRYNTPEWDVALRDYLVDIKTLQKRYAQERELSRIPVKIVKEQTITLSPGGQNVLVELILREFAERFVPGGKLLYLGDTDEKFAYFDEEGLQELGVTLEPHGKIPDIILYDETRNWLVLIEAVTSHGPMTPMRHEDLKRLFGQSHAGLVFVTAFLDRQALKKELSNISWETEVWVAESPSHLIHFDGERFLGPY
ncbi:MAG: BsuBI/PstI family type II restriction endonuclease [Ktedonobacteraceae bacterium]